VALENVDIPIEQPSVMVGLLIGGSVAFMFSAQAIRAVGRAAGRVVFEVRKQFREHPGIMDYTERPNYGAVVDICTRDSLRELLTPGLLAVLTRSPPASCSGRPPSARTWPGPSSPGSCWP
jgi:K(+)-stimulated pyrophosphate-energized sodium pump